MVFLLEGEDMRIAMTIALLLALLTSVSAQETVVTLVTHDSFAIGEGRTG